jgi:hypothetical protein
MGWAGRVRRQTAANAPWCPRFAPASSSSRSRGGSAGTAEKRTIRWPFEELNTLRRTLPVRAGRGSDRAPKGKLTLTFNANPTVQTALLRFLAA